jgi:hypothetical protein
MRCASAVPKVLLLWLLLCVALLADSAPAPTARERYGQLRTAATKAYRAKDYQAARAAFLRVHQFVPNHPAPIYNLACVAEDVNHGVLNGVEFSYIDRAGWNELDEKGNRKEGIKHRDPVVRRFRDVTAEEVEGRR